MQINSSFNINQQYKNYVNNAPLQNLQNFVVQPKDIKDSIQVIVDDISIEISKQSLEQIFKYAAIQTEKLRRKKQKEVYYNNESNISTKHTETIPKGIFIVVGNLNLINTKYEDTSDINTIHGNLLIGKNEYLKDISSIKNIYGDVCVEANSREEAIQLLNSLNFKPQKVLGDLVVIQNTNINE